LVAASAVPVLAAPNPESRVIVDLVDKYRSARPKLGYQQFRDLWQETAPQDSALLN
jgi:hypothetical protein